jgi:hypothetical protein
MMVVHNMELVFRETPHLCCKKLWVPFSYSQNKKLICSSIVVFFVFVNICLFVILIIMHFKGNDDMMETEYIGWDPTTPDPSLFSVPPNC